MSKFDKCERAIFADERAAYHRLTEQIATANKGYAGPGVQLICIGEAAGSHAVTSGLPSGGFLLRVAGRSILVDPGANSIAALMRRGIDPYEFTDVAATHAHNDHVGNLTLAVSAARSLGFGGGHDARILVCPSLVDYLHVESTRFGFTLPAFAFDQEVVALSTLQRVVEVPGGARLAARHSAEIQKGLSVGASPTRHGGIEGVGFVFDTPFGRIGYTGDTGFFNDLLRYFEGSDLLWLNMNTLGLQGMSDTGDDVRGEPALIENHLGYLGVCRMIEEIRPSTAVVCHFGAQLLGMLDPIEAALKSRFEASDTNILVAQQGTVMSFARSLSEVPATSQLDAA